MQPEQQNNPQPEQNQDVAPQQVVQTSAPQQVVQPTSPEPAPPVEPTPQPVEESAVQDEQQPESQQLGTVEPVQWQAPEYIEHQKSPMWFVGFWGVVVLLMLAAAFLMKSWSFTILVPVMATALVFYSHRPPRMMSYVVSDKGIYINEQLHPMSEFRSFGVSQEDAMPALIFIPTKRFRPGLTVYFPQEAGEEIVDLLGSRIPMNEIRLDAFDRIVRKLRI